MNLEATVTISLGEWVKMRRIRLGLLVEDAAEQARITPQMWLSVEENDYRYIHLSTLIGVCDVLGYTASISLQGRKEREG